MVLAVLACLAEETVRKPSWGAGLVVVGLAALLACVWIESA